MSSLSLSLSLSMSSLPLSLSSLSFGMSACICTCAEVLFNLPLSLGWLIRSSSVSSRWLLFADASEGAWGTLWAVDLQEKEVFGHRPPAPGSQGGSMKSLQSKAGPYPDGFWGSYEDGGVKDACDVSTQGI